MSKGWVAEAGSRCPWVKGGRCFCPLGTWPPTRDAGLCILLGGAQPPLLSPRGLGHCGARIGLLSKGSGQGLWSSTTSHHLVQMEASLFNWLLQRVGG